MFIIVGFCDVAVWFLNLLLFVVFFISCFVVESFFPRQANDKVDVKKHVKSLIYIVELNDFSVRVCICVIINLKFNSIFIHLLCFCGESDR